MRVPPLTVYTRQAANTASLAGALVALVEDIENKLGLTVRGATYKYVKGLENEALELKEDPGVHVATPAVVEAAIWNTLLQKPEHQRPPMQSQSLQASAVASQSLQNTAPNAEQELRQANCELEVKQLQERLAAMERQLDESLRSAWDRHQVVLTEQLKARDDSLQRLEGELTNVRSRLILRGQLTTEQAEEGHVKKDGKAPCLDASASRACLSMRELQNELERSIDGVRAHLENVIAGTRDALESRFHGRVVETQAKCMADLLELRADMQHSTRRCSAQIEILTERVTASDGYMRQASKETAERVDTMEAMLRDALVDLRHNELRTQEKATNRLRTALGSVTMGLARIAEICGLMPDKSDPAQLFSMTSDAILNMEEAGQPVWRRIDDAWKQIGVGHNTLLDLMQHKAEQSAHRFLRAEISDMDVKIHRICADLAPAAAVAVGNGIEAARVVRRAEQSLAADNSNRTGNTPRCGPHGMRSPATTLSTDLPHSPANSSLEWTRATAQLLTLTPLSARGSPKLSRPVG